MGSGRADPGDARRSLAVQGSVAARRALLLLALPFVAACATAPGTPAPRPETELPAGAEAWSLSGQPLFPPALDDAARRDREDRLAEAKARVAAQPDDVEAIIWLGRRLAYLGRYREAIAVYSDGISRFPQEAKLYRHRGHRYITTRRFDVAIADLDTAARLTAGRADEIEPDGLPNPRNIPTSTLHFNVWYHLGLARYAGGDFERALQSYRECRRVSTNPDMLVATTHWLYMTLRRLGRDAEAAAAAGEVREGMEVIENRDYHRLVLMYRGKVTPEALLAEATDSGNAISFATVGYGVGNWHLYNGRRGEAIDLFRRVVAGGSWASFGHIAAEAELARMGVVPR